LDLKHLRQLTEVADKGSIRAAAESLAITQPALSRSIRSIENELGIKLVERGPRGAELTAAGNRLLGYARIIDANLTSAENELRGLRDRGSRSEQIAFGMSWLTEALIAAQLIERVLRDRPGIRLTTLVGDFESLAPKLVVQLAAMTAHLDLARNKEEDLAAGVAVTDDHRAGREVAQAHRGRDGLQIAVAQTG
jgi:DNA-binding transcriptional LysR family regulator